MTGIGLLTGGIILAIMVTPIITAVIRDVLAAVPDSQREAAFALGATKWETIRIVLVNGAPGIAGLNILPVNPDLQPMPLQTTGQGIGKVLIVTGITEENLAHVYLRCLWYDCGGLSRD